MPLRTCVKSLFRAAPVRKRTCFAPTKPLPDGRGSVPLGVFSHTLLHSSSDETSQQLRQQHGRNARRRVGGGVGNDPFCLLDEVDATLDDANVVRFREVVEELEDRSQFILITHNKRTMSYASQLYGVTQREKGVSMIVSVKMERGEGGGNGAARNGEPIAVLETEQA